jgi:hypothetical protein
MLRLLPAAPAVLLACSLAVGAPAPAPKDPHAPVLIAEGAGYSIHALPPTARLGRPASKLLLPSPSGPGLLPGMGLGTPKGALPGVTVVHTTTATGVKKQLVQSGTTSVIIPMGIDRIHHSTVRVAGVAADSQRLYVLCWHAQSTTIAWHGGHRADTALEMLGGPALAANGTCRLLVFRTFDGRLLHTFELKRPTPHQGVAELAPSAGAAPRATTGRGLLRLTPGGVSCFGETFAFRGEELAGRHAEKK